MGNYLGHFIPASPVHVADTDDDKYLIGRDISIFNGNVVGRQPHYVWSVIEVKKKQEKLSGDGKGQLVDYLCRMADSQPGRIKFTGLPTNINENVFTTVERCSNAVGNRCTIYRACRFEQAMAFVVKILSDNAELPDRYPFSPSLGLIHRYLGQGAGGAVAEFHLQDPPDDMIDLGHLPVP